MWVTGEFMDIRKGMEKKQKRRKDSMVPWCSGFLNAGKLQFLQPWAALVMSIITGSLLFEMLSTTAQLLDCFICLLCTVDANHTS